MNSDYQRRLQEINARIDRLNDRTAKPQTFDVQRAARTGQTIANTPDYTKTIERLEANKKARQEPINPKEQVSTEKEVQREWGWKMERHGKEALTPDTDADIAMKLHAAGHPIKDIHHALDKHSPNVAKTEAEKGTEEKNRQLADSIQAPREALKTVDLYKEICEKLATDRERQGVSKQRLDDTGLAAHQLERQTKFDRER